MEAFSKTILSFLKRTLKLPESEIEKLYVAISTLNAVVADKHVWVRI
jgi:hypothetical protein